MSTTVEEIRRASSDQDQEIKKDCPKPLISPRLKWWLGGPLLSVCSLAIAMAGGEIYLRVTKHYRTYAEQTGGDYAYIYDQPNSDFRVREFNQVINYNGSEFSMEIRTNSEGIRDDEHPVEKAPGEFRIATLGDSFGEGAGASLQETWYKQLEQRVRANLPQGITASVISGSVSGNDPFFAYKFLKDRLLKYKPDLVIVTVNESDILDTQTRGGLERYDTSLIKPRPMAYYREKLYAHSYLVRMFMHDALNYSWMLISDNEQQQAYKASSRTLIDLMPKFKQMGEENGFKTLIVYHPGLTDLGVNDRMQPLYDGTIAEGVEAINLTPDYLEAIKPYGHDGIWTYIWPEDNHYKPAGYAFMADLVYKRLRAEGLVPTATPVAP